MTLADRIVVFNAGIIEQVGKPMDLYHAPANLFVAGFIGSPKMNFLTGDYATRHEAATIGVRPEHLVFQADGPWTGTIAHAEHLGADSMYYVDVPGSGLITARVVGDETYEVGASVRLAPIEAKLHRFDAAGKAIRR